MALSNLFIWLERLLSRSFGDQLPILSSESGAYGKHLPSLGDHYNGGQRVEGARSLFYPEEQAPGTTTGNSAGASPSAGTGTGSVGTPGGNNTDAP